MANKKTGGKGSKKIGRSARKPSHARYNSSKRWEENKARRIAKQKKKEERAKRKRAEREKSGS